MNHFPNKQPTKAAPRALERAGTSASLPMRRTCGLGLEGLRGLRGLMP